MHVLRETWRHPGTLLNGCCSEPLGAALGSAKRAQPDRVCKYHVLLPLTPFIPPASGPFPTWRPHRKPSKPLTPWVRGQVPEGGGQPLPASRKVGREQAGETLPLGPWQGCVQGQVQL